MGDSTGQEGDLVRDEPPRWDVAHRDVVLELSDDPFLRASAVVEVKDVLRGVEMEGSSAESPRIGEIDSLAICRRAVARDDLRECQRNGPVDDDLARGDEEPAAAQCVEQRLPAVGEAR